MSDAPGEYKEDKFKELVCDYLNKKLHSSRRLKDIILPVLLEKNEITRSELKKVMVKSGEAENESQAGYFLSLVSSQLGHEWKDYLRQVIGYSYPNYTWEKDNFFIRTKYKSLVKDILNSIS